MLNGTPNEFTTFNGVPVPIKAQFLWYEFWGSDKTFPHFAAPWAWAMDTPFKWTKQVASHFGGTSQGVAMSWPGHINDAGGIRRQFHHVIDIVPTILEATGISMPETLNGIKQRPMDGVSMGFGLFSPSNGTVIAALFLCALSVSGAIFLILEMDDPLEGMVRISDTPMRSALSLISN